MQKQEILDQAKAEMCSFMYDHQDCGTFYTDDMLFDFLKETYPELSSWDIDGLIEGRHSWYWGT